jgi:hypothetical protein
MLSCCKVYCSGKVGKVIFAEGAMINLNEQKKYAACSGNTGKIKYNAIK